MSLSFQQLFIYKPHSDSPYAAVQRTKSYESMTLRLNEVDPSYRPRGSA